MNADDFSTGGIDLTDYFGFSLTPDPGFLLNLASLAFSERRSGTGIHNIEVRTSLDGFTSAIFTTIVPDNTLTRRQTISLTAPSFQNLSGIEFRLYGYMAESGVGTWRLGISNGENPGGFPANLELDGMVTAVPEPATLALLGTGLAAFAARARRRRK